MQMQYTRLITFTCILSILTLAGCAAGSAQPAEYEPTAADEPPPSAAGEPAATASAIAPEGEPAIDRSALSPQPDSGARSSADPPATNIITGTANVNSIDIALMESMPVQVQVMARGDLPDGCTEIGETMTTFDGAHNTFTMTLTTVRPADAMCTAVLASFEERIALPVEGLKAGTYTVDVNGVRDTFELAVDNILQ